MSLPLFFMDSEHGMSAVRHASPDAAVLLQLPPDETKHMHVLRMHPGEKFLLSDGLGSAFVMELVEEPEHKDFAVTAKFVEKAPLPYRPNLTLVQGVSKGERMDLLVRQAVELGVRRIAPAMTERCVVKLDGAKRASRAERWRSIALAAAKQSGQPLVPEVLAPMDLEAAIAMADREADIIVCPWEEALDGSMTTALAGASSESHVFLFIGPEGGFSPEEVDMMRSHGGKTITLGDTILRTETAGIIASALAIYELGGLGNAAKRGAKPGAPIAGFTDDVSGSSR